MGQVVINLIVNFDSNNQTHPTKVMQKSKPERKNRKKKVK